MLWDTLKSVRASVLEFSERSGLRAAHHFVQLPSGRWTRTLGPPQGCANVRGNVWRMRT